MPVSVEYVTTSWVEWLALADDIGVEMPDRMFNWPRYVGEAAKEPNHFLVGAVSDEDGLLGLHSFRTSILRGCVVGNYVSVRPDCRKAHSERNFEHVGRALVAQACQVSMESGWQGRLHLGPVLPESESFFRGLGASTVGLDPDNLAIMELDTVDATLLIQRYYAS